MNVSEQVLAIQRSYPRIFFACHTEHVRCPSKGYRLSESDSSVLQHLDHRHGCRPGELAAHPGISPSSLSATVELLARGAHALLAERGSATRWERKRRRGAAR